MIHSYDQEQIVTSGQFRDQLGGFKSLDFHEIVGETLANGWGISRGLILGILFTGLLLVLNEQIPNLPLFAFEWIFGTLPVWLPVVSVIGGWKAWLWWARSSFIAKQKPILLEVKFPRDLIKSPRAMETVLAQLWTDSGETTFFNRVYQGQVRPYFSLEIASFGGEVHFYIWSRKSWRHVVESAMYAQYPEVELVEVEDYAMRFEYDPEKVDCFCTDWRYEPRNDAYQLRTYIEYELEKDPKEEYKIDPFAQVIERLSALKPSEQMWIQIIITQSRDVRRKKDSWFETESRFIGLLQDEVDNIRKNSMGDQNNPEDKWRSYVRIPQHRQAEQIRAIDRNLGKLPFNVGARGVYIASPEDFNSGAYTGLRWIWRPMANPQSGNQMRPRRWHNPFDYPWQDLWNIRDRLHTRRFFDVYRRRSHFYTPWVFPHNMMSTEPIATLWHPPSSAITSPGLERISAKKAEPPPNLPK